MIAGQGCPPGPGCPPHPALAASAVSAPCAVGARGQGRAWRFAWRSRWWRGWPAGGSPGPKRSTFASSGAAARPAVGRTLFAGRGDVADPGALGIEADEPGSMWLKDGILVFRQPAADLRRRRPEVDRRPDDQLLVQFVRRRTRRPGRPARQHPALADAVAGLPQQQACKTSPWTARGNRLLVWRGRRATAPR